MIGRIALKNFKAFSDTSINLGTITLLIGANGAGKSSILQALTILKQSRGQSQLQSQQPYVSLGDYKDIVHNNDVTRNVQYNIEHIVTEPVLPFFKGGSRHSYEATFDSKGLRSQHIEIQTSEGSRFEGSYTARPLQVSDAQPKVFSYAPVTFNIEASPELANPLILSGGSVPSKADEVQKLYEAGTECLRKLFSSTYNAIGDIYYVPALRGFARPSYALTNEPIQDLSSVGAGEVQAQNVASTLAYRRDLESKVSKWTKMITGTSIEAPVIPGKKVSLGATVGRRKMNIVNDGFGTNQLVQLLLQLAISPTGSLIAIEEPEIHIHPEAQSRLCKILVELAKAENKQTLITTRSEHILTSILTSVANKELKAKDLSVYYFEKVEDEAKATLLTVNHRGQIKGGLKGFFEASIDELEEYMKALSGGRNR